MPNRWNVIVTSPNGHKNEFKNMKSAWEFIWVSTVTIYRYWHWFNQWVCEWCKITLQDPFITKKKKIEIKWDVYSRIKDRRKTLLQSQTK